MNFKNIVNTLLVVLAMGMCACDSVVGAGASALLPEDGIRVKADTFAVTSSLQVGAAIAMTPDSFLLGECDTHFGTVKADILTQFACPLGFEYPYVQTAEVDSVCLYLYYRNWYGDGLAPLGISVYEMDKATLDYNTRYPSDTTLSTFCSLSDETQVSPLSRVVIAERYTDSVYSADGETYFPCISIKLTDDFARRFFAVRDFSSQEQFNELFKGLYITTDFGGSTVLYVTNISMAVYYHFSYPRQDKDTVIHDMKAFYANSEVRQLNRFAYPDRDQVLSQLQYNTDTNYVVSPANIYTRLSVKMDSIFSRMEEQLEDPNDYRVYVNKANLTVDVLYDAEQSSTRPRDQWDIPASHMLLVLEDKMESFFAKNELPSDTAAILSALNVKADTVGNLSYGYTYDLSGLLTQQLHSDQHVEQLNFYLVPVAVQNAPNSTNISSVKPLQTISSTCIRSANNSQNPMNIKMVYSGFNKRR
jgi:hypothetical protein